jgi:hypothetical protein
MQCFAQVSATFSSRSLKHCACRENEPETFEVLHLLCKIIIIIDQVKNDYGLTFQNIFQVHQLL